MFRTLRLLLLPLLLLPGIQAAIAAEEATRTYVVRRHDDALTIARRLGTTVEAICEINGLYDPELLYHGQTLLVPPDAAGPPTVTANNPAFGPAPDGWPRLARTGPDSLLLTTRVVSYYGNPLSDRMGILGELSKEELVARLRRIAAEYERAGGRPVKPAIEMVVTVAQGAAGSDGMWRLRMDDGLIQEYADLAAENDMLFIMDVQIGHSDWATEIEAMRPFLSQPNVHLAMDPEFDMAPGQAPGDWIGGTTAADINHAVRYLAGLSEELNLPPKILIVHQFTPDMIQNKTQIVDDPRVDLVVVMDGFGGQYAKRSKYDWLVRDEPVEFGGFKLFYRQDVDLFTPNEVSGFEPTPAVVIYQ